MSRSLERIGAVAVSTSVSRVLGLARDALIAGVFGTTLWNSAFQFAFMLPNLFRRLLAEGQLNAALVPTLAEEMEARGRPGVFALLNRVLTWLLLATAGLALLAIAGLALVPGWWPGLDERHLLGARLAQVLFPYLVFVCLAAALSAVLQLLHHFSIPALTAVWLNLAILTALGGLGLWLAETPAGRMAFLCGGVLVGGALQLAIPWLVLRREGWRPGWEIRPDAQLFQVLRLMAPGLIGTAIYQVNLLVSRSLGFSLNESAVTVLTLASRLMEVPQGIFTVSVATVVFPLLATHAARGEMAEFARAHLRGLRLVLAVTVPAAAGLALLSVPVVGLVFERGAFTAADTALTAPILAIFALGLPFYSAVTQCIRGCYALKDTRTPVRAAAAAFVVNLAASLLLMGPLGTAGLAWAGNLAIVVQAVWLERALAGKVPALRVSAWLPALARILVATALMSVLVWSGWRGLQAWGPSGKLAELLAVGGLIPVAIAAYGGALWALRIEDREELAGMARRLAARLAGRKEGAR